MLLVQKMCGIHLECFQVCQICLLQNLGNLRYILLIFFDLSNFTFRSCIELNRSTKNNIHLAISQVSHWIHLLKFVSSKAILLIFLYHKSYHVLLFSMLLSNKKHRQHVTLHRVFLQKSHQSFCIGANSLLLVRYLFCLMILIDPSKRHHNKKILYQLIPIYLPWNFRRSSANCRHTQLFYHIWPILVYQIQLIWVQRNECSEYGNHVQCCPQTLRLSFDIF